MTYFDGMQGLLRYSTTQQRTRGSYDYDNYIWQSKKEERGVVAQAPKNISLAMEERHLPVESAQW